MFKGSWDSAIQMPRYAKLYLGLNVIGEEAITPLKGLHSVKIPFMRSDHGLVRYKKFKMPETYAGYKIRCDQEIKRLEQKLFGSDRDSPLAQVGRMIIDELKYVQKGPYDANR